MWHYFLITLLMVLLGCSQNSQAPLPDPLPDPTDESTNPDSLSNNQDTNSVAPTDSTAKESEPSSPNILLIIGDDIGVDAFPRYNMGTTVPQLPNLEKLAKNGIQFNNVWAYPLCSPTRASILTGRYGYRTGVLNPTTAAVIPSTETSIHKYIKEHSKTTYQSALIGKWHLSRSIQRVQQVGIEHYAGFLSGGVGDYYSWDLTTKDSTKLFTGYITEKFTDLAIEWIHQQTTPWFCWLAYTSAHTPFHLPPDSTHNQGNLSTDSASIAANPFPYFLAMMENMDYEIGRLLHQLSDSILQHTTILFIGDNGTLKKVVQPPYSKPQSKGSLYQGGIHVPMIASGANVRRANQQDSSLIQSVDLFATIANLTGALSTSTYHDSYSFKDLLSHPNTGLRHYNYSEILGDSDSTSGYAIRNKQYKLIAYDDSSRELYNLAIDPYEKDNLLLRTLNDSENQQLQSLLNEAQNIRTP